MPWPKPYPNLNNTSTLPAVGQDQRWISEIPTNNCRESARSFNQQYYQLISRLMKVAAQTDEEEYEFNNGQGTNETICTT